MNKYFILILLGLTLNTFGQTDPDFPNSEIEVIKSFNARLAEAQILDLQLPAHQVDTNRAFIRQYKLSDQPVSLTYPAPQVKPLAMPQEENPVNHPFYARLGYGLQTNPFAELAYYASANRFNLLAYGSYEGIKDLNNENKKFQDIEGRIKANIGITDMLQLNTGIKYLRQSRTLYASDHYPLEREREFIYDIPEVSIGIQNALETKPNIDYKINYTFRNTSDNFDNSEANHNTKAKVVKNMNDGKFHIGISAGAELNTFKKSTDDFSLNNYFASLLLGINQEDWNLSGDVGVALLEEDTKILPNALLNIDVSPAIRPYLGVRSNVKQQNFYALTRFNPYLQRQMVFHSNLSGFTNEYELEAFVGLQGEIEQADYELRIAYALADQKPLFINNFSDTSTFRTILDDVNTLSVALRAESKPINGITLGADILFNSYTTDRQDEAWHLPTLTWGIHSSYDKLLNNKLITTAQLTAMSGIKYQDANGDAEKLGTYFNFSLLLDYEISEKFGAFLHLNNLFDSQKPRYFGYDRVGINPQIGIKVVL